jgi:hypothetical protein
MVPYERRPNELFMAIFVQRTFCHKGRFITGSFNIQDVSLGDVSSGWRFVLVRYVTASNERYVLCFLQLVFTTMKKKYKVRFQKSIEVIPTWVRHSPVTTSHHSANFSPKFCLDGRISTSLVRRDVSAAKIYFLATIYCAKLTVSWSLLWLFHTYMSSINTSKQIL